MMMPKKKIAAPPSKQSQKLVEAVTESIIARLMSEAESKGGILTVEDIEALGLELNQKKDALKLVFDKSFADYVKTRERAIMNLTREHPFGRLIVSRFARLFKSGREAAADGAISRRCLPGFFLAMNMMMGLEAIEALHERTSLIVKRLSEGREMEFNWEEVYQDEAGKELVLDALVAMTYHFKDFKKRADWFINMINGHLPPVKKEGSAGPQAWIIAMPAFKNLLKALFSDLTSAIGSENGRLFIFKKYGVDACLDLTRILKQFD